MPRRSLQTVSYLNHLIFTLYILKFLYLQHFPSMSPTFLQNFKFSPYSALKSPSHSAGEVSQIARKLYSQQRPTQSHRSHRLRLLVPTSCRTNPSSFVTLPSFLIDTLRWQLSHILYPLFLMQRGTFHHSKNFFQNNEMAMILAWICAQISELTATLE